MHLLFSYIMCSLQYNITKIIKKQSPNQQNASISERYLAAYFTTSPATLSFYHVVHVVSAHLDLDFYPGQIKFITFHLCPHKKKPNGGMASM